MTMQYNFKLTPLNRLAFMFSLQAMVRNYRRVNNIPFHST